MKYQLERNRLHFLPYKNITVILIFLCLFLTTSCHSSGQKQLLKELDMHIGKMDEYALATEKNILDLKIAFLMDDSDSTRWETVHQIVNKYRFFNLDSMSRYIGFEKKYASTDVQIRQSIFDDIYEMAFRGNDRRAAAEFSLIDTTGFPKETYCEYLRLGIDIFKHDKNASSHLEQIRHELLMRDTVSYIGSKNLARHYRKKGDLDAAITIFQNYLANHPNCEEEASVFFNLSTLYGMKGDSAQSKYYLIMSAIADVQRSHRDFQSLYKLALLCLNEHDYERAGRYIDTHYSTIAKGLFYPRLMLSGNAVSKIAAESIRNHKIIRWIILIGSVVTLIFAVAMFILFRRDRTKSIRLQAANDELVSTHKKLALTSHIKENYVARYMLLSRKYLGALTEQRLEFKRALKEDGPEELYKRLKQVDKEYLSEKEFYRIFDEAFLDIFPDFIHQVNLMIDSRYAFDENTKTLPTEIRILAVIRLGITSSPNIAEFLNCSLNTVYTYRGKIRNISIVGKDKIEDNISLLNS